MKLAKTLTQLLILLAFCAAVSSAQAPVSGSSRNFASLEGGYTLQLPANAMIAGGGFLRAAETGMGEGRFERWQINQGQINQGQIDPGQADQVFLESGYIKYGVERSPDKNLETAAGDVLSAEAERGLEPLSDKQLAAGGRGWKKGRELLFEANSTVTIYRIYAGDDRLIRLRTVSKDDSGSLQAAYKFLNSLRLGSREDISATTISDTAPADLPQQLPAQFIKPDAEDMARGKVKSILEEKESADLKDPGSAGRSKRLEHNFDPRGFLTKTIVYDAGGLPQQVTVYGFIDGARVSKSGFAPDDKIHTDDPLAAAPKKRDDRYSIRVAEKYDSAKRVIERTFYDNAGDQFLRSIYAYREGHVEVSEYRKSGAPDSTITQVLDARGNQIENTTRYLGANAGESHYVYKYLLFDQQGNWTKRTVIFERKEDGKMAGTSTYTEYRAIDYW